MSSSTIVFLIDIQNGFACEQLTPEQGGSLYVPGGERVGSKAADLIHDARQTVFVLSQDFHPHDHISFASNHGVEPFSSIRLRRNAQGFHEVDQTGPLEQTTWLDHCKQGSHSALPVDAIMAALPDSLRHALQTDVSSEVLFAEDTRQNRFYVIRKGMRSDLDSYGIATENDQQTTTSAPAVFQAIAEHCQQSGSREAAVAIGGLATNYCVEFSHRDLYKFMLPALQACQIQPRLFFLSDISAGIEVSTADGSWPDHAMASQRMTSMGTEASTCAAFQRYSSSRRERA